MMQGDVESEHSPWEWAEMDLLAAGERESGGGDIILLLIKSPLIILWVWHRDLDGNEMLRWKKLGFVEMKHSGNNY